MVNFRDTLFCLKRVILGKQKTPLITRVSATFLIPRLSATLISVFATLVCMQIGSFFYFFPKIKRIETLVIISFIRQLSATLFIPRIFAALFIPRLSATFKELRRSKKNE